jgi:hypothetical protein
LSEKVSLLGHRLSIVVDRDCRLGTVDRITYENGEFGAPIINIGTMPSAGYYENRSVNLYVLAWLGSARKVETPSGCCRVSIMSGKDVNEHFILLYSVGMLLGAG